MLTLLSKMSKSIAIPRQSGTRKKTKRWLQSLFSLLFPGQSQTALPVLTANSDLVQPTTTHTQYGLRHSKITHFKIRLKEEVWSNSSAVFLQITSVRRLSGKHWGNSRGHKVNNSRLKKGNKCTTTHFHPAVLQQKKHWAWERKVLFTKHSDLLRD